MSDQKNNASHLTVDEKILLSEYRKTGLTPKLIMTMKAQLDEKYTNLLVCKYWGAALKIHNINKLLRGDCSYCVHKEELKRKTIPCVACYHFTGIDGKLTRSVVRPGYPASFAKKLVKETGDWYAVPAKK